MSTIRIYADFNNLDEDRRVRLNTVASLRDIEETQSLRPGLHVILYMTDEFEVEGVLDLDGSSNTWVGMPIWSTIKYYKEVGDG